MSERREESTRDLEARLRAERAAPSSNLLDQVVTRVDAGRPSAWRPRTQLALVGAVTASLLIAGAALGLLSRGGTSATSSAAAAADAVKSAVTPASSATSATLSAANTSAKSGSATTGSQASGSSSGSAAATSDATAAQQAVDRALGTGITDLRRFLAQVTVEPANAPSLPAWLCHSDTVNGYNNGVDGRLEATTEAEYDALVAAHGSHPFDKGFYFQSGPPNCTQINPA